MYLAALLLTFAVEVPAYASILRQEPTITASQGLTAGVAVNLVSHPLAFLVVMPRLAPALGYLPALALVETGVWGIEAVLLTGRFRREPELLSLTALLANALSLAAGLALLG